MSGRSPMPPYPGGEARRELRREERRELRREERREPRREEREERWTKAGPLVTALPAEGVSELQQRVEASVGEPGAFSLFGFAIGTLLIAIPLSGLVPLKTGVAAALAPVLAFAGIAQFIGGLVALRKGNTFAGTAFCSYGANDTLVATYFLFRSAGVFPATADTKLLLGVELFCFAYMSIVLARAAARVNLELVAILAALVPGFGLVAVQNVGGPAAIGNVGGYFLILSALLTFYGASALVLNTAYGRALLPLLSRT
jgi:succinate-acetate transporter protein